MNQVIYRHTLFIIVALLVFSCRQAKYVPEGNYPHKKNSVYFETHQDDKVILEEEHENIYVADMYDLIRPTTNERLKLFFYNRIDSARYAHQVGKKREKYKKKNDKRAAKEKAINDKRIAKAKEKGETVYNHKTKEPKEVRNGWRNWVVEHMGASPVILDTNLVVKSTKQLDIYMSKCGFFDATVRDTIIYKEKKHKAFVEYIVTPGQPYIIDSIILDPNTEAGMKNMYSRYIKKELSVLKIGGLVDENTLDLERDKFSKYCRDEAAFFGFNKGYINFEVDTLGRGHNAKVIIHISPRAVTDPNNEENTIYVEHQTCYVRNVTFLMHNTDTLSFYGGYEFFKRRCAAKGLPLMTEKKYTLLDTLWNIDTIVTKSWLHLDPEHKKDHKIGTFEKHVDTLIDNKGYFVYNGIPYLNPDLLDKQNFLEVDFYAKEYYLERTYRTMLQLDVFSTITPVVEIDPNNPTGKDVNVVYHLVPAKRQTFVIEPRATNSNSILGVSGSVSYTNKNLFKGAQKLKVSFVGGLESQPLIIEEEGEQHRAWNLNTFEWGPTVQLTFPKLVPMRAKTQQLISKRAYPQTKFDLAVNFQKRVEFKRRLAQFNYEWNFKEDKTREYKIKIVNFDFVKLEKSPVFEQKLIALNDPFLSNSYADHFTLYNQFEIHYSNQYSNTYKNIFLHDFKASIWQAGGILNSTGFGSGDLSPEGLKRIFGVPFSQFIKIDNQYIFNWKINKKNKIATRVLAGVGWAYGNSPSLPYEQSFFAGGANDMRAFDARTMAPGSIRVYEDSTATTTQIGDMRLEWNLEYRFSLTSILEGALFVDMGNIWKMKDDPTTTADDLGLFTFATFWRQTAIGTGLGIRADLSFLIVRADVAFAIHNPYLPAGERWVGTPHPIYKSTWDSDGSGGLEVDNADGVNEYTAKPLLPYHNPFGLRFNIGIGYPF